jgi:hypothetical protein
MGILDEAIRDHLELKRRGGAAEGDLRRLEDEAFGPPSRPDEPQQARSATATPEAPTSRALAEEPAAPAERPQDDVAGRGSEGVSMFHDFAAEEGLVSSGAGAAPLAPTEKEFDFEAAEVDLDEPQGGTESREEAPGTAAAEPESPTPEPETPTPPEGALRLDDTQPHDMASELGETRGGPQAPAEDLELDEELELELDEELEAPSDSREEGSAGSEPTDQGESGQAVEEVEVIEEVEFVEEGEDEGGAEESEESGDDVLEETPDFLRETPEHDRLWFEQKPPKDFDFDE